MKKIKEILCLGLFVLISLFIACNNTNPPEDDPKDDPKDDPVTDVFYKVTFVNTSMKEEKIKKGEKLVKPTDPQKSNYLFGGWYEDSSYTKEITFPIIINQDTNIYAYFYNNETAFSEAREKTIGEQVAGYEYDYTIDANVSYNMVALKGNTVGKAKYSTIGDVSYYDEHINSGLLFYDGSEYQIKRKNELQKISLNEKDELRDYSCINVDDSYKFDSSSFAKALFEYNDSQLKSIEKTNIANEYKLKTSFNASSGIALAGKYINSSIVEKMIGTLPETSVTTGMWVTFSNGEINSYRYEMHINVESIKFDLVYKLTFKNSGIAQTITPRVFTGLALAKNEIDVMKKEVDKYLNDYTLLSHSSYDYEFTMGVDYYSNNEINATFKGSTMRKIDNNIVYFHNDINIDSDYKNADLYKAQEIADIHIKKTMLSSKEVYNIEKKLFDKTYLVENYQANTTDSFFLFYAFSKINNFNFGQKITNTKNNETTYSFGISKEEIANLLEWFNTELDFDPLNNASVDVKIFGDFTKSSVVVDEFVLEIVIVNNRLAKIIIESDGDFETKMSESRDFSSLANATYQFKYLLETTTNGNSFEPFDTVNKAK